MENELKLWLVKFPISIRTKQAITDKSRELLAALDTNIECQITRLLSADNDKKKEYISLEVNSYIELLEATAEKLQGFIECYKKLEDPKLLEAANKYNADPTTENGNAYLNYAHSLVGNIKMNSYIGDQIEKMNIFDN